MRTLKAGTCLAALVLCLSACATPERARIGYDPAGDLSLPMTATRISVDDARATTDGTARPFRAPQPGVELKDLPPLSRADRERVAREVKRRFTGRGDEVRVSVDVGTAELVFRHVPDGTQASATATVRVTLTDAATGKKLSQQTSGPTGAQGIVTAADGAQDVFQQALVAAAMDALRRLRDANVLQPTPPNATFQRFPGTEPKD